ncbi:hypothetical protein Y1Q_0001199 [Alligator mississippiensis]|uniref:Uncharacterized protein n=1 Tax=Alligator mississippiensis TaxID=8496 RepID=A0A151PE94_ALLMI|nr:hypothetical protein Y1Q_0001199 [Alligator mississippiensis]
MISEGQPCEWAWLEWRGLLQTCSFMGNSGNLFAAFCKILIENHYRENELKAYYDDSCPGVFGKKQPESKRRSRNNGEKFQVVLAALFPDRKMKRKLSRTGYSYVGDTNGKVLMYAN